MSNEGKRKKVWNKKWNFEIKTENFNFLSHKFDFSSQDFWLNMFKKISTQSVFHFSSFNWQKWASLRQHAWVCVSPQELNKTEIYNMKLVFLTCLNLKVVALNLVVSLTSSEKPEQCRPSSSVNFLFNSHKLCLLSFAGISGSGAAGVCDWTRRFEEVIWGFTLRTFSTS